MKHFTNTLRLASTKILTLPLMLLLVQYHACAAPRAPLPPLPELVWASFSERFDAEFHAGRREPELGTPEGYKLVESFSGYALQRAGSAVPFVIDGVDGSGHTNLFPNGAIRLWVKPNWSSASTGEGQGPGQVAQVLEMSIVGKGQSAPVWNLEISADGSVIMLQGVPAGAKESGVLLSAKIAWRAGEWHQVLLNHTEQATTLILDGEVAAEGLGVLSVPPHAAALTVASSLAGSEGFDGEVEEVFCFVRPLTTAFHWFPYKDVAILGPISAEEMAYRAELAEKWKARKALRDKETAESGGGGMMLRMSGPSANCVTNGPVYLTNALVTVTTNDGWTIYFDIAGGTNEVVYDIFSTPELVGSDITNSIWTWLETGMTCETHYFTNQATNQTFYILTVPGADRDADGLYDGWEWKHFGTLAQTATGDFDGDGTNNGNAYTNASSPNNLSFALIVTNFYVRSTTVPVMVSLTTGIPASMAVLVDSTNLAAASWTSYEPNITANFAATEGWHEVWGGCAAISTKTSSGR